MALREVASGEDSPRAGARLLVGSSSVLRTALKSELGSHASHSGKRRLPTSRLVLPHLQIRSRCLVTGLTEEVEQRLWRQLIGHRAAWTDDWRAPHRQFSRRESGLRVAAGPQSLAVLPLADAAPLLWVTRRPVAHAAVKPALEALRGCIHGPRHPPMLNMSRKSISTRRGDILLSGCVCFAIGAPGPVVP